MSERAAKTPEPSARNRPERSAPAPVAKESREPETGTGATTTRERLAADAETTRERLARLARAAQAEPVAKSRSVEPAPVEAGPEAGLELELEERAAPAAAPAHARRRAALRGAPRRGGEIDPSRPGRPAAWPPERRPGDRARDPQPADSAAIGARRSIEAHARGPPWPRRATPTTNRTAERVIQAKLAVSTPGDAFEREADAVAARVLHDAPATRISAPVAPRGSPQGELPPTVEAALHSGGGRPLDHALRARIEPHLGVDLRNVRVRQAEHAARDLGARAFTSGATIFLGAGASSNDIALMAHEATHVAQQRASPTAAATLQRLDVVDLIPDWILDGVRAAVRALPGYELISTIVGQDLLTGEPAHTSREDLVETLLTYGPFGAAVGPLLSTINVIGDVVDVITTGLAENNLTLSRIGRDIETAWDEFSISNGIEGNLEIVERLIDALLRDIRTFVSGIVDRVIELVRAIVATVAEPLLETPEIKPYWDLARKVLHYDPLRGERVEAETVDIIADFLHLIGEDERLAQMRERGTLQETADWLDTQLATFADLTAELGTLFSDAWAAIQPENLPDLLTNLESLAQRAFGLVQRVGAFVTTLLAKILELVKDALLGLLRAHARGVPGYDLLTVIIGQDPFTGETVERNARNLIRGFITLMPGGEATYDQLEQSGVIDQAATRIESEMARLGISLELITGIFPGIWDTLTLDDLLDPIGAFVRIIRLFGDPLARLFEFVTVVIEVVVMLVLRLMNFPTELLGRVVANATQAINDIAADPVGFLLHLLEALKLGLASFFDHFLGHLMDGLVAWLFRGLGQLGIQLPSDFSLGSVLGLIFQVLGLTIDHLWEKLGEHIGPERVAMIRGAIDHLGEAWAFITEVQRDGLPAIWRFISSQLGNLWSTLLDMAKDWIMTRVVASVTTTLLSMLDPTGIMAVVNSCIAFFRAIQSAIDYLRDLLEIIAGYVDTMAAVAAGNVAPGAQMLERGLARAMPVAIGFLANQVGLGNIPEKIVEIIGRLRELVDRALDWLIEQALRLGRAALDALGIGGDQHADTPEGRKQTALTEVRAAMTRGIRRTELITLLGGLRTRLQLRRCELVNDSDVLIENSPAETIDGVLAWSPAEVQAATGRPHRIPGRGGRDMVLGNYRSTGETVPTVRSLLEPFRESWAAWEATGDAEAVTFVRWSRSLMNLPLDAFRPSAVHAEFRGVLEFASGAAGGRGGAQGQVGDLGDLEYAVRRGNWSTAKHFQGGHVIASELAGPETFDNLVPMRENLNERLYRDVESYVVRNLPSVFPGENPHALPMVAELDWTMGYPAPPTVDIGRLGQLVASEISPGARSATMTDLQWQERLAAMRDARRALRSSMAHGHERVVVPTRVPTAIGLHARFATGEAPAGTPPPAATQPTQSRSDPLITLPSTPAATAAAATTGPTGPAAPAAVGPWEQAWNFTQST